MRSALNLFVDKLMDARTELSPMDFHVLAEKVLVDYGKGQFIDGLETAAELVDLHWELAAEEIRTAIRKIE